MPENFSWPSTIAALRAYSHRWLGLGLDLVYPPRCASCGDDCLADTILLCTDCRRQLTDGHTKCPGCAANLPEEAGAGSCLVCRERKFKFQAAVRLGPYEGMLRDAVLRLKHHGQQALATALARLLAAERGRELAELTVDVVIPIPLHWSRRMRRGANHPDLLANELARQLAVPAAAHLLRRTRRTATQTRLTTRERFRNLRGAFQAGPDPDLAGARVLLVDDVMTTGATAHEAAKALLFAGASFVGVAILARTEGFD